MTLRFRDDDYPFLIVVTPGVIIDWIVIGVMGTQNRQGQTVITEEWRRAK